MKSLNTVVLRLCHRTIWGTKSWNNVNLYFPFSPRVDLPLKMYRRKAASLQVALNSFERSGDGMVSMLLVL